jgi:hypothetical protein
MIPPYTVDLACDENKRIVEIRIQKKVRFDEFRLPKHQWVEPGHFQIDSALDDPHFQDLLELVQYIESLGSLHLNLRRIHWTQGEYAWIPESSVEEAALQLYSLKVGVSEYNDTPKYVNPGLLGRMINARGRLGHLTVPMAFFREGVNEFRAFRYISAFHNHYFFLEGLFAGGKTNNKQVVQQFLSSPILREATQSAIVILESPDLLRHRNRVRTQHQGTRFEWTAKGLIEWVVWMRGNLHHFSIRATTPKGHPLNHREFESTAYVLQMICYEVVIRIAV